MNDDIKVSLTSEESVSDKVLRGYDLIPWLFDCVVPNIQPDDYITQLAAKNKAFFGRFTCPSLYTKEILEKYKDNFMYSFPSTAPQGVVFSSFFGIAPDILLISTSGFDKTDNFVASVQVHTTNPKNFFEFIKENRKFEFQEKLKFGF